MKIVAIEIFPSSQRGGSEKAFFEVLCALKKLGHVVILAYCRHGDFIMQYEAAGIQTFLIKSTNIQDWFSFTSFRNLRMSAKKISIFKPDIIYINYLADSPLAAILKIFYQIPSICHIRVPYMGSSRQFSFCAKFINAFVVLNQQMKDEYQQKEKLKNVNIVSDSIILPKQIFDGKKKNAAVFMGRISPEKGINELLKTWQILRDDYQIIYPLDIIGPAFSKQEKNYSAELLTTINSLGLKQVRILPAVNHPVETLSEYHFAVMPSLWEEPFGRIIPEAIVANTPIFARNVGITKEILRPQQEDLIFNTEQDLAQKISLFLKGNIKINMVALKKHIVNQYSIDNNIKNLENLMLDILV